MVTTSYLHVAYNQLTHSGKQTCMVNLLQSLFFFFFGIRLCQGRHGHMYIAHRLIQGMVQRKDKTKCENISKKNYNSEVEHNLV